MASRKLEGKRALIWGGATGLGFACAQAMAEEGATVFIASRREDRLRAATEKLAELGRAGYRTGDATIPAEVEAATEAAAKFMGGLDTVVISSGTSAIGSILDITVEQFRHVIDANLMSVFLGTKLAVPHLLKAGSASVIAIASMYGLVGQTERVAYCTSKAGVINMVRAMALDLADKGVRVNAISPGFIETELALEIISRESRPDRMLEARRKMHAIPRAGQPMEIGRAAAYLASED